MTEELTDRDWFAEAMSFADELDLTSFTAPDDETVRVPLRTLRKAAKFIRLALEDAVEHAEQARAAHDCVTAADRIIQKLQGENKQ